ncbi:kelch-like protein 26 [Teleopsis dalmanni]|uniref:kelch-like protein 26 n=1 Tax=Teleopsis dalmanni TaxID=139649 RepID=UPI0018CE5E57|nr:kelch-like protein 26 [Teleopsis dalmanni]
MDKQVCVLSRAKNGKLPISDRHKGDINHFKLVVQQAEVLQSGLYALRSNDQLCDITLVVEGRSFKAHRVVLAACSDYFRAMFTDAVLEARQSKVQIHGISARGIELLINFIYTSNLVLDYENVQDVLAAAIFVQMKDVIDACCNYLESHIDLENSACIASLADIYSLDKLQNKIYRFICSNLNEFSELDDFYQLKFEQVKYILSSNYPVNCTEKRVLMIILGYCRKTNLNAEPAASLFSEIRFSEVGGWDTIIKQMKMLTDNEKSGFSFMQDQYIKAMLAEYKEQQTQVASFDIPNEAIASGVLLNSRGLELALVKIGGFETHGITNQINWYNPSTLKWEVLTAIPHIDQCNFGTAVLGNELYVVGGAYDVNLKEYVHSFGFRYCPIKDEWNAIAPIQIDRCRFSLNAIGNKYLYAVGGVCEPNDNRDGVWKPSWPLSNVERYDAVTDTWQYMPILEENRSQHAGVVIGDQLYISGGTDQHLVLKTFWRFDSNTEKWHKLAPMLTPRADHALIALNGLIYACGGWYENPETEAITLAETMDVYNIATDEWTIETNNPTLKHHSGIAAVQRKIYFIGGLLSEPKFNRATCGVQCYDLDTKEWSFNKPEKFPKDVWECACVALYVPSVRSEEC